MLKIGTLKKKKGTSVPCLGASPAGPLHGAVRPGPVQSSPDLESNLKKLNQNKSFFLPYKFHTQVIATPRRS